jgi:chemotaxis protein histidine kinase CheA
MAQMDSPLATLLRKTVFRSAMDVAIGAPNMVKLVNEAAADKSLQYLRDDSELRDAQYAADGAIPCPTPAVGGSAVVPAATSVVGPASDMGFAGFVTMANTESVEDYNRKMATCRETMELASRLQAKKDAADKAKMKLAYAMGEQARKENDSRVLIEEGILSKKRADAAKAKSIEDKEKTKRKAKAMEEETKREAKAKEEETKQKAQEHETKRLELQVKAQEQETERLRIAQETERFRIESESRERIEMARIAATASATPAKRQHAPSGDATAAVPPRRSRRRPHPPRRGTAILTIMVLSMRRIRSPRRTATRWRPRLGRRSVCAWRGSVIICKTCRTGPAI